MDPGFNLALLLELESSNMEYTWTLWACLFPRLQDVLTQNHSALSTLTDLDSQQLHSGTGQHMHYLPKSVGSTYVVIQELGLRAALPAKTKRLHRHHDG